MSEEMKETARAVLAGSVHAASKKQLASMVLRLCEEADVLADCASVFQRERDRQARAVEAVELRAQTAEMKLAAIEADKIRAELGWDEEDIDAMADAEGGE